MSTSYKDHVFLTWLSTKNIVEKFDFSHNSINSIEPRIIKHMMLAKLISFEEVSASIADTKWIEMKRIWWSCLERFPSNESSLINKEKIKSQIVTMTFQQYQLLKINLLLKTNIISMQTNHYYQIKGQLLLKNNYNLL